MDTFEDRGGYAASSFEAEHEQSEPSLQPSRRGFLRGAGAVLTTVTTGSLNPLAVAQKPNQQDVVSLSPIHASTEAPEKTPGPFEAAEQRVGYAIVGLGRLSLNQILPAFGKSKYSKPVALVSGDHEKARKIAAQYGIRESAIYDYSTYDQLAQNPEVQAIYIVLPNSMHTEYVLRGAKAGKHILCEKPMATSVRDCERMIAACSAANIKLMIAYRQQYEPMNREIVKMVRSGSLGKIRSFIATNAQDQGDPTQWRLRRSLAGGGCLPDVGIYCLNAARFLTGEEPSEVSGTLYQPTDDPRFKEVEETCSFTMKFPSGFVAICSSGYGQHKTQYMRLEGDKAWAEMNPAFGYSGLRMRHETVVAERNVVSEPSIEMVDQFATEMDHMSLCIQQNLAPHTPGEEGLQDQRIVDAIYESAKTGRTVRIAPPAKPTRGPEPQDAA